MTRGRGRGHRFMAHDGFVTRLEGEERRRLVPTREIVPRLGLREGDTVLDLGAGTGYFSFPMAECGASVIALDIEPKMLQVLSSRAAERGMPAVDPVMGDILRLPFASSSVDVVFAAFVYHEVPDQGVLLGECARVLKPSGKLAVVDFQRRQTPIGPPVSERKPPSHVRRTARKWFRLEWSHETETYYQLMFSRL